MGQTHRTQRAVETQVRLFNRLLCLVKISYRDWFWWFFTRYWLVDYLLPIVGWLVCVTCYTFQPINYNAVANLFRVHCVGWWWLTCLYPICGFDIYIGAILASSCICNWVWSTWGHNWRDLSPFAREMASSWRIRKWNQSMRTVAYTIQERVFACRMSNAG